MIKEQKELFGEHKASVARHEAVWEVEREVVSSKSSSQGGGESLEVPALLTEDGKVRAYHGDNG